MALAWYHLNDPEDLIMIYPEIVSVMDAESTSSSFAPAFIDILDSGKMVPAGGTPNIDTPQIDEVCYLFAYLSITRLYMIYFLCWITLQLA